LLSEIAPQRPLGETRTPTRSAPQTEAKASTTYNFGYLII
jgi:hypothetical protein